MRPAGQSRLARDLASIPSILTPAEGICHAGAGFAWGLAMATAHTSGPPTCGPPLGIPEVITKNSLPVGAELLVDGYRAKDGSYKANGRDITFADGKKVFMGGSSPGAPPR